MEGRLMETLDTTEILLDTYQLADCINQSEEVQNYLDLQRQLQDSLEAQQRIKEFQKMKELYEETQRFGIFHPDYQAAKKRVETVQQRLHLDPVIRNFLLAEKKLDQLLYQVALVIAESVSDSIKVPTNDLKRIIKNKGFPCGGNSGS
jgi:cell fate (sporulation/competence/biofilm development) regulator YlbF (YheA/YmcA/DUF963 family)